MLSLEDVISRVRTTLQQQVSVTAVTRENVKWSSETKFSDEDLVIRITDAERTIMNLADAGTVPSSINQRSTLVAPYLRLLENRVFRINSENEQIRCVRQPQQSRRSIHTTRVPNEEYPTYTFSNGVLTVYPSGSFVCYILDVPALVTTASGILTLGPQYEEAIVQHVCSSCRTTMSREGVDVAMNELLSGWHNEKFAEEITPYLRATKLTVFADSESTVEREAS